MSQRLSIASKRLLPTQLRLDGTFQHKLVIIPGWRSEEVTHLTVEQAISDIHLTLRHRAARHSCTIPRTDLSTVVNTAQQWIEDAANGRLGECSMSQRGKALEIIRDALQRARRPRLARIPEAIFFGDALGCITMAGSLGLITAVESGMLAALALNASEYAAADSARRSPHA